MPNRDPWPKGDRRQLTVLFCDVAGSTEILERLDEEEWSYLLREYHGTCGAIINDFDGHIAQYLGDGLLAYFGYPHSHEHNPQRAIKAALGIIDQTAAMNGRVRATLGRAHSTPLILRLAIHTGLVVVDELGRDAATDRIALGMVPTVAARLQQEADGNSVVISEATHRLVQGAFECRSLGSFSLKGISVPQTAYQVVGQCALQGRFDIALSRGLTPFVDRQHELAQLAQFWEEALQGQGRVVLIEGDPGIGKSRLVREFTARLQHTDFTALLCRCSPYHRNSAYYPVINLMLALIGAKPTDSNELKAECIEKAVQRIGFKPEHTVPLLSRFLSVPYPQRYQDLNLSAPQEKQRLHELLERWVRAETSLQPLRLFIDDLHWIDPSSRELLDRLVAGIAQQRLLVLLALRPEIDVDWRDLPFVRHLMLSPLNPDSAETLVRSLKGAEYLPGPLVQKLVAHTDGVPLFIEESTLMALTNRDEQQLAIPSSLHDLLMERLDRLGAAKPVAQLAAIIGPEFSYEILQAVALMNEASLQGQIEQLVASGLVSKQQSSGGAQYSFKHALIRDAAYQSMLARSRKMLHGRVADVLSEAFPEVARNQPELIAHHYTLGAMTQKAVDHWHKAGLRCAERYELQESIRHLRKGLELLATLPNTAARLRQELEFQSVLAGRLIATQGYGADSVEAVYSRALELAEELGDAPRRLQMLLGLESFNFMRSNFQAAQRIADQCLPLARQLGDPARELIVHWTLGEIFFHKGDYARCETHVTECMNNYRRSYHRPRTLQDPAVMSYSYCAWSQWMLGYPDRSLMTVRTAISLAEELRHPFSKSVAYSFAAGVHLFRGELEETVRYLECAIEMCTAHNFPVWLAYCTVLKGLMKVEHGDAAGIADMESGIQLWQRAGSVVTIPYYYTLLAQGMARLGRAEAGLERLETAQSIIDRTGEHYYEAELCRIRGELIFQARGASGLTEATALLTRAFDIATHQMAKSWQLRALISLNKHAPPASRQSLLARLDTVYRWFTEGAATADLREAERLLAQSQQRVGRRESGD